MFVNQKVEKKVRTQISGSARPSICNPAHGLEHKNPLLNIVQYLSPRYKGIVRTVSAVRADRISITVCSQHRSVSIGRKMNWVKSWRLKGFKLRQNKSKNALRVTERGGTAAVLKNLVQQTFYSVLNLCQALQKVVVQDGKVDKMQPLPLGKSVWLKEEEFWKHTLSLGMSVKWYWPGHFLGALSLLPTIFCGCSSAILELWATSFHHDTGEMLAKNRSNTVSHNQILLHSPFPNSWLSSLSKSWCLSDHISPPEPSASTAPVLYKSHLSVYGLPDYSQILLVLPPLAYLLFLYWGEIIFKQNISCCLFSLVIWYCIQLPTYIISFPRQYSPTFYTRKCVFSKIQMCSILGESKRDTTNHSLRQLTVRQT